MTALFDLTVELPAWAVVLNGVILPLLGRAWITELPGRRHRCGRCSASAARHERLATRAAWLGWPGHHAGHLPIDYGDHIDPARMEPAEQLPARHAVAPTGPEVRAWVLTERFIEAAGWEPCVLEAVG